MGTDLSDAPEAHDHSVGLLAVHKGLLTRDQLEDCRSAQRALRRAGVDRPIWELLLERKLVSGPQAEELLRESRVPKAAQRIAGFEVIGRIGHGAMGVVYRARQLTLDKIVALKILAPHLARDPKYVERFLREARAAGALNHGNIVRGIDVGESNGFHYFAMELVEGETLYDLLKRRGRLPEAEAFGIALQIARALDHAARRRIVHRDIKPANILITGEGVAKLADLGLARQTEGEGPAAAGVGALGTPNYIAPEQARGEPDVDGRADLYSLGATLFHALIGKPPFQGTTASVIMAKHLTEPVLWPAEVPVSPAARAVVEWMMEKDRSRRYQRAADLAADLEAVLDGRVPAGPVLAGPRPPEEVPLEAIPEPADAPAGRRGIPGSAIVVPAAAALAAIAFLLLPRGRPADPASPGTGIVTPSDPLPPLPPAIPDGPPSPPPDPPVEPPVVVEPPPAHRPEDPAAVAWRETEAFARAHAGDPLEIRARYLAFAAAHPRSREAEEAKRRVSPIDQAFRDRAAKLLEPAETAAAAEIEAGDLGASLSAVDGAPAEPGNPLFEETRRTVRSRILIRAGEARGTAVREAQRLLDAGDRAGADAALSKAERLTPAGVPAEDLEWIRAEIRRREEDERERDRRKTLLAAWRGLEDAESKARAAMGLFDFAGARRAFEAAAEGPFPSEADRLKLSARAAALASEAWDRIRENAPTLLHDEVRVNGARVRVEAVDGETIRPVGMGPKPLTSLDAESLVKLAGGTEPPPAARAGVGVLLLCLGRTEEGDRLLGEGGPEGQAIRQARAQRAPAPPEIARAAAEEEMRSARDALGRGDAGGARRLVEAARQDGFAERFGEEGAKVLGEIEKGIAVLESGGTPGPKPLPGGRVRSQLSFRTAKDLEAFADPRDAWGVLQGSLILLPGQDGWGRPLRTKETFEGDFTLEVEWTPAGSGAVAFSFAGAHLLLDGAPLQARVFEGSFGDGPPAGAAASRLEASPGETLRLVLSRDEGRLRLSRAGEVVLEAPARAGDEPRGPLAVRMRKSSAVRSLGYAGKPVAAEASATPAGLERGLVGLYFRTTRPEPQNRVHRGPEGPIDFDWGQGPPKPGVPADNFSARWTGFLSVAEAGDYQFATESDDGARLRVKEIVVIEDWREHPRQRKASPKVPLPAGLTRIQLEYFDRTGGASIRLFWKRPGQEWEIIPADRLFHARGGAGGR